MKYLIPFNIGFILVTYKYQKRMSQYSKQMMGFLRKRNRPVAAIVCASLLMSTSLIALLVAGNCAILGVNPYKMYDDERNRLQKF